MPTKLRSPIKSFRNNMWGTVQYNGCVSKPCKIRHGLKQGCELAPTLLLFFRCFSNILVAQWRTYKPSYTNRRQSVEPLSLESNYKSKKHYDKRYAVCRQCSSYNTYPITHLPIYAQISDSLSASKNKCFSLSNHIS